MKLGNINKIFAIIEGLYISKGLKRKEFEQKLNLPQSFLSELKSGRTQKPSADRLTAIANFFGVSTNYILGNEDKNFLFKPLDSSENANDGNIIIIREELTLDELLNKNSIEYDRLTEDECKLLENYRKLDDENKKSAFQHVMLVVEAYNTRMKRGK